MIWPVNGKRTAIILGAGASRCYEDGRDLSVQMPLQKDIVGSLGRLSASSGSPCEFTGPSGLAHSPRLYDAILDCYGIDGEGSGLQDTFALWEMLRSRGESLEMVFARLAESRVEADRDLLFDFAAILRASVRQPIAPERKSSDVCRHHRALAEALDPGDCIISFNWDSLMADALTYYCPFWYPATGLGVYPVKPRMALHQKALPLESLVQLIHIHGSILLYEHLTDGWDSEGTRQYLYWGPPGFGVGSSLLALLGAGTKPQGSMPFDPRTHWAMNRDFLRLNDRWFRPVFVPPTSTKGEYSDPYHTHLRTLIHTVLPVMESFVIVGYSFPSADLGHLRSLFAAGVIKSEAEATVVNLSNPDPAYQALVRSAFPSIKRWDFSQTDFARFGSGLTPT